MHIVEGTAVPPFRVPEVDAGAMRVMALLLRDGNPIHWDVSLVQQLGLGDRPVNQGPVNVSYVLNALTRWAGGPSAVRSLSARFLGNVFAGDDVVAGGVVTGVTREGDRRLASCDVWLDRADGVRLLQGTAVVRLPSSWSSSADD